MGAPSLPDETFSSSSSCSNVRVVTRIRPLSETEKQGGAKSSLTCLSSGGNAPPLVQVTAGSDHKRWFEYDAVCDGASTRQQVYVQSGAQRAVTHDLFQGFHCTILA